MAPVGELRFAIPYGVGLLPDMPLWQISVLCGIANMIPVPFLILFSRTILNWMKNIKFFAKIANKLEQSAISKGEKLKKGVFIGLLAFVAIPIPGTGAWTGSLIASLFNIRLRTSVPVICLGVAIADVIVSVLIATGTHFLGL